VSSREEIEGIRRAETESWIGANTDAVEPPFEWTRLTGGTSNLTYAIRDGRGRRAVVRRPPMGKLLPKAHDMEREHEILAALASTDVPVAKPFALCSDREVTGAPFYVMEFRQGEAIRDPAGRTREIPLAARAQVGPSNIDAIVALHRVDPKEVGLEELGRHEGYIARQLNRWFDSWQRSHEAAQIELPGIEESFAFLSERIPEQGPARICHGDYGLHNVLTGEAGEVVAITDWEICTLGDPLADITYFIRAWSDLTTGTRDAYLDARLAEGYDSRRALIDRYSERSGREINDLGFYLAFNAFKICCIVQGVYARFRSGVRGSQGMNLDDTRKRILHLADETQNAIRQL
jgi:aminoglycoside phosphotransferase (APT) family kinase protein